MTASEQIKYEIEWYADDPTSFQCPCISKIATPEQALEVMKFLAKRFVMTVDLTPFGEVDYVHWPETNDKTAGD
jgi:hypothetical protein